MDQTAIRAVALDDLRVELDTHAGGEAADGFGEIRLAAGFFEAILARQSWATVI